MIDKYLLIVAVFFFVISFAYRWGLLYFFREQFRWSLASVVGIASVVSMTYVFVWQIRGIDEPIQAVVDLVVVFLAALPGMIMVDYSLRKEQENHLSDIKEQIKKILQEQKENNEMISEVLALLGMRNEAIEYLNNLNKVKNLN